MHEVDFAPLLIITTLAFLVPIISAYVRKVNVPVVVGEILCGIVIGKSGLDIIQSGPWLNFLSLFGFTFLMFVSGMEIDLSFLRKEKKRVDLDPSAPGSRQHDPLTLGGKLFFLTLLCALIFSYLMAAVGWIEDPLFLTLVLSTTSVGIVVPTLRELGASPMMYGQDVLFSSLVADFVTMILITVYVAKISTGLTLDLLLILLLFVAFLFLYRFSRYWLGKPVTLEALKRPRLQRTEVRMRAAFAVMVFFIVLSQKVGIEIILGAFLAGFLISMLSAESDLTLLQDKLNAVGFGFFIPLFFIMVGVRFDLRPLLESPENLLLLPVFLLAAYLVKIIPCFLLRKYYNTRNSLAAGILLASRLTLIIAAADIGIAMHVISPATHAIVILVAVISSTISPILFIRVQSIKGKRP